MGVGDQGMYSFQGSHFRNIFAFRASMRLTAIKMYRTVLYFGPNKMASYYRQRCR